MIMNISKHRIFALIVGAILIAADQFAKIFVARNFDMYEEKTLIKGILEFYYLPNDGAAMGIMSGKAWYLVFVTGAVIIAILIYMFFGRIKSPLLMWSLGLITSGGIGNLIDRIRLKYVIDFVRFPVSWFNYSFNIADCAVTIGAALIMLYFIIDIFKSKQKNEA